MIYDRLTAARRLRLHQRLGEALEKGYHGRTQEIAAALAMHFEQLLAPLAGVYGTPGQIEAGLHVLDTAFTAVARGERAWEAGLYRLKGELLPKANGHMRMAECSTTAR